MQMHTEKLLIWVSDMSLCSYLRSYKLCKKKKSIPLCQSGHITPPVYADAVHQRRLRGPDQLGCCGAVTRQCVWRRAASRFVVHPGRELVLTDDDEPGNGWMTHQRRGVERGGAEESLSTRSDGGEEWRKEGELHIQSFCWTEFLPACGQRQWMVTNPLQLCRSLPHADGRGMSRKLTQSSEQLHISTAICLHAVCLEQRDVDR